MLIGVDDKNSIKGVSIDNSKRSAIQNSIWEIFTFLLCEFYVVDVEGKNITVIEVQSGQNLPYVLSRAFYVRQGLNPKKRTTIEEMGNFFQQDEKIYFDEASCKEIDIKKDIPKANIDTFRFEAGLANNISDEQVFSNLRLISNEGYLKNGAVFFCQ